MRGFAVLLTGLFITGFALGSVSEDGSQARIPVSEVSRTPTPVAAWDPASPQRLVRIDGTLFQEDSGFYYRVVEDQITVRLAEGTRDWNDLLQRAVAAAPATHGILEALTPRRQNRLGIVDLTIPDGSPEDWCALVFETGLARYAEVATYGVYAIAPNDPMYNQQWALNNTGQTGGTPGADVDAELAWDISAGNTDIIVAVLDSGTDVDHPDLEDNVWINEDEIPNNGVDDDGNGYIDDWIGWDFEFDNNDPNGSFFHGTHVTGIVNAVTDNGIGIAGLAGGMNGELGARGMALGVGSSAPVSSALDDAIIYAADNGAQVITMSLSVPNGSAINDALDYAYNQNDVFVDCAAGNGGSSVAYPATRPEVMAVASTTDDDVKSSFSNPGPEVEVAAPGSNILSTQLNGSYGTSSGTSFAAPYVAGLAALVRGVNPGLSAPDVRQLIIDTSEDVGPAGFDNGTGWGRINAFQALSSAGNSDGSIELDADVYACTGLVNARVTDFDLAATGSLSITIKSLTEPAGESVLLTEIDSGTFAGSLNLAAGAPSADGILQVAHGDTMSAEYVDADDGQGGVDIVKTYSATLDCVGPQIFDVLTFNVDDSSAAIAWTTDEVGTSLVRYGSTTPPDQVASSILLTTDHVLGLNLLDECTTYKFEVESIDALGNANLDDNGGQYFTFQTLGDFPGVGVVPCQQGQAELDRTSYGCSSTAQASITDIDLDTDSGVMNVAQVLMTSTTEPAGEWITVVETGLDTGVFVGSIDLGALAPTADGQLSVEAGDLITATYYDADDGLGQPHVATATSTADCTAPSIQNVQVTAISSTRAEIQWTTDEPATSRVDFGADAALGSVVEDDVLKTSHNLAISAFEACDRVHFRVTSADEFGDVQFADSAGQPFELNLNQIGGLVFHDNFETDDGWSLQGEWERGTPQGLGSSAGDPTAAYSGNDVLGSDLSGNGAFLGDYESDVTEWVFSPPFSTTGSSDLELILRRHLGVDAGDSANLAIVNFLTQTIWTMNGPFDDGDWVEVHHDLSALDDKPSVQIGFGVHSNSGHAYGWNIDEVIVKDSTQPDYLTCGDCGGAPTFGGLSAVFDPAPCAASGLALEWQPAPAWGTGTGGTYDVHRGATADFVPDDGNRIASGLGGTSWTDPGAPLDTPVWYVVRARNDEDCGGGEGLADVNLVRLSATETISQPPADSVTGTLLATPVGGAHVRLSWDAAAGTDHYVVRRSTSADFGGAEEIGTTGETLFEDVNAATADGLYTYRVFSANACGDESP